MSGAIGTFPPICFPPYSTRSIWKVIQKMIPYPFHTDSHHVGSTIHNAINGPHLYIKNSKGLCSQSFKENQAIPTSLAPKKMGMVTIVLWFPTINIKVYIYIIHSHDYAWFDTFYPVIVGDILYPLRTFKNHIDGIRPWLLWIPQTEPTDRH